MKPLCCLALFFGVGLFCCTPKHKLQAEVRPTEGLVVACDPADAQIFVDDRYCGTVESQKGRPLTLPVGFHRIELRKEGYWAQFFEVNLVQGVRQKIEVKLRKEPF
ncbi:MAG: PEGA domain-containing protein [Pseudomonadota bacterium]